MKLEDLKVGQKVVFRCIGANEDCEATITEIDAGIWPVVLDIPGVGIGRIYPSEVVEVAS